MGVTAKQFLGIDFYRPGAYGTFKPEPDASVPSEWNRTMLIIGQADNGNSCLDTSLSDEERVIIGNYAEVSAILKKGELLDAAFLASQPGFDNDGTTYPGPRKFILLNINPNVKASVSIDSTSAGNAHLIEYPISGPAGNKVRIKKTVSTKKIEIGDSSGVSASPTLEKICFDLIYSGDASTAILTNDGVNLTVTLAGDQTDGSLDLTVPYAQFETIGDVVDYVNSSPGYVATVIDTPDFLSVDLDHIEATDAIDVKTLQNVYADLWMEEKFLSSTGLAEITPNALRKPLGNMTAFAFLSGGSTGVAPANAIKDAIDFSIRFQAMTRNILSSVVSDAIYLKQVCYDLLSPEGGSETFGGAGSGLTDVKTDRYTNANSLSAYWMNYGASNFTAFDSQGRQKEFPGYMLSVIDNAISASVSPRISPTNKTLNIVKGSEILSNAEFNKAIKSGALVVAQRPSNGSWYIDRSVTTEKRANLILNNKSSVLSAMWMTKRLREGFVERFIGQSPVDKDARVIGITDQDVVDYVKAQLQQFVYEGLLVGSELLKQAAFSDKIKVSIDQNAFYLVMEGNITMTIDFIFYLMNLKTIKGEA